jgi:hypothetical protein
VSIRRYFRTQKKDIETTVKFPVFFYAVKVVFTHSMEKAFKRFKHTRNINPLKNALGITVHVHDEELTYIFLRYECGTGVIAHESYHAICNVFKEHTVEATPEVMAYHLQYLVQEIVDLALGKK